MSSAPWGPLGLALRDFSRGDLTAALTVHMDDGTTEPLAAAHFFRSPEDFPANEMLALESCRGSVVDLGAGAGTHALALQRRDYPVCAVDISPLAVEIMRERGVKNPRVGDVFGPVVETGDTLLMLMNGIGVAGTLAGLDRLLVAAHAWLNPGGQWLFDSTNVLKSADLGELRALELRRRRGRYDGELEFCFEYKGKKAPPFFWLFVDPDTLRERAGTAGWRVELLSEQDDGEYLARLTAKG